MSFSSMVFRLLIVFFGFILSYYSNDRPAAVETDKKADSGWQSGEEAGTQDNEPVVPLPPFDEADVISFVPEDAFRYSESEFADSPFVSYGFEYGTSSVLDEWRFYRHGDLIIVEYFRFNCGNRSAEAAILTKEQGDGLMSALGETVNLTENARDRSQDGEMAPGDYYYEAYIQNATGAYDIVPVKLDFDLDSIGFITGWDMDDVFQEKNGRGDGGDGSYLCFARQLERHGFPDRYEYIEHFEVEPAENLTTLPEAMYSIRINGEEYWLHCASYCILEIVKP